MDEKTRQLVRDLLLQAHEAALRSIQVPLDSLPEADQSVAHRSIEEFRACMLHLCENTLSVEAGQDRITALIHGHSSPQVVQALQDYAEAINYLLIDSRNSLLSMEKPKGN